jgi:hypothetical protein
LREIRQHPARYLRRRDADLHGIADELWALGTINNSYGRAGPCGGLAVSTERLRTEIMIPAYFTAWKSSVAGPL